MDYELRLWSFVADMNRDGAITISDVWMWFKWLYFYPGDGVFYTLMSGAPKVAEFFELSAANFGGVASGVISFFMWLIVMGILSNPGEYFVQKPSS